MNIFTKTGKLVAISIIIVVFLLVLLCGCSKSMLSSLPQSQLQKPSYIVLYHGITKYILNEDDTGYSDVYDLVEATWLSDKRLSYRASSFYDAAILRNETRVYFVFDRPIEWLDGEISEKYKGYCFFIPKGNTIDGEFIGFTDESNIGSDTEKYSGPRYYEYSETIANDISGLLEKLAQK